MQHTDQADHAAARDKERTRRAILDAATRMFFEHGAGVSLADIAAAAGVSKGALMHHFRTRGELEVALQVDGSQRFWEGVMAHVDLSENRPGKLLRGYIRALTSDEALRRELFSPAALMTVLATQRTAKEHLAEDARRWNAAFDADGIDPALSQVLRNAADGLAANADSPYLTPEELRMASAKLLAMAEPEAIAEDRPRRG